MIITEYAKIITLLLLVCTSIKSSHSQRTYDKGDWIPLISSCPTCQPEEQSENRKIVKKEATGRVLNVDQDDHPNHFVNNDKFVPYNGDQNFRLEEADSYEDFRNYYNFNKPFQGQQENIQDTDSYVEETSKRQQLLAQKALEPLFLNQELQPPKPVSLDSQEQTNNLHTSSSKEQSYQNSPRLTQYSNNQLHTSNTGDNIPPVRFNLLQSNVQSTQHSLETPKLENNQKFSEGNDNENSRNSNNQHAQYSVDRHNYSSPPFTNSPTFQTVNAAIDKKLNENRSPGTFQFSAQTPFNQNTEISNIPNHLPSIAKESDIRPQGGNVALPVQNRFSVGPDIPLLRSLSDSDMNPNFSPPQLRNMIQDVNAGLQPELSKLDNAAPPLYQQAITGREPTSKDEEPIEITTPTSQPNRDGVELLYVPVQYLNKQQEQPKHFSTPEDIPRSSFPQNRQTGGLDEPTNGFQKTSAQPFKQAQQIEGIQNDFANQALGAFKLQQQLHSGEIPITSPPVNNFISSTTKSVKKKKSHQPPLAVYMESDGNVKVTDVLNLLKSSRTISVQDTVGPDTPPVFVGPYDLDAPEGYAKFDLPYLSSLDANQIENKADEFPFFVAPINYKAPEGYSKIPLPSPHVGTIVLSEKNNVKSSFSKTSQNAFGGVSNVDIPERKQHYRDTLDQPNYQTKLLPSNVETPLSIRQTTDHNDYNQLNNHFLHQNQRIPTPQSKFEEEYNKINNIYRTTPKPQISQFVITTSTSSPLREQQQYVFNPQTGFIEQISQTRPFIDHQRPIQPSNSLVGLRGELTHASRLSENLPTRDITEHQQASAKSQENIPSRSRLTENPKHNEDISTTLRTRGRFREANDQISTKPTRGRGSSHYSSSSFDNGDKQEIERPKTVQRNRGSNASRNRVSTIRSKEESNQQWQKHVDDSNPSNPILGSRSSSPSGVIYNDDVQTNINNLGPSDKTSSSSHNSVNIPQVPYYEEISDIQPFNQQVPTSLSLKQREEAKKQRTQSVSSLEQNLGIPITSNGASGVLSQSVGDDSYGDPLLKSTEEPVFEFTTRSQPASSRPSTFESYEIDSTHSDESREFDDFFLTSSEHEEEPKNLRVPSQIHSANPVFPGLINNLQDQSIRSILNPALIAPTTQQSIDDITTFQRMKLPHTETNFNAQNSFLKPQQNYQTPQSPTRVTENYESNTQQQKNTIMADNRRNPLHLEPHKLESERPSALPTNEQQSFNNLQPSGSFSITPQSLSSPSLQSLESSTHLPTIETTTVAKRGRGRFRSRGPSGSTTTTASTRRNLHRTRRPLKVEPRSESLDQHQTASSTYSPIKLIDATPVNTRYQTINNLGGLGQYYKNAPQEKSEYYQKVQGIPEYERMPNSSSNQLEPHGSRLNNFYNQPTIKEYVSDTSISAPNNYITSNGAMSALPIYRQENFNVDPNQPVMFNRDVQLQGMSHLTAPSANGAEQAQSHSSNVQFIHPDNYSNSTFINFIPRSNSQHSDSTEGGHVQVEKDNLEGNSQHLNYNTAPSAEAALSETTEGTTIRNLERGRVRGRTGTVPVTERTKATTLEKPKVENEEFYGFFRSPNFNTATSSPTPPTSHGYISSVSSTGNDFANKPQSYSDSSQGRNNDVPYSSTQKSSETSRPRYSSVIRQPTGVDKESDSAPTTKQPESTQRTRKRGRTRRPTNVLSTTRANEQTEATYTRRYTTTVRPSIRTTQRLRTRGRVHFQPPQSLKEKREDDLETANYPASFLASQGIGMKPSATRSIAQTENPSFQITIESGFDANEDLTENDQLTNPSYVSTSIVLPDGRTPLLNQIENEATGKETMPPSKNRLATIEPYVGDNVYENVENTTDSINSNKSEQSPSMRKRGFWRLVKHKILSDPLEAAESQHVSSVSANSVIGAEGKHTKEYEEKNINNDNIPQMTEEIEDFGNISYQNDNDSLSDDVPEVTTEYDLNESSEFNDTESDNPEIILGTSTATGSESQDHSKNKVLDNISTEQKSKPILSTEVPPRTTNSFEKSMRTLQSTEISHETEICYRGKCIRTSNPSL